MILPPLPVTATITIPPDSDLIPDGNEPPRVVGPHLSFSQVSTYLRCSMQYWFAYCLRLRQRPNLPLSIGKGGHATLEYNARHKIRTGDDLATSDMLDMASTFLDLETADLTTADLAGADRGDAKDRAIAAIRVYRTRDAATVHPAGVEVEFNLDLASPDAEPIRIVNGKIDLITTDRTIEDYKFIRQARTQLEVDISPQLTLYGKVFQTLTGAPPVRTGYRMFLPGSTKTPPDARTLYRDPSLMTAPVQQVRFERLAQQFRQVERGIRNAVFIPTDDAKTCSWCGYRDRCQSSLVDHFEAAKIRTGETN